MLVLETVRCPRCNRRLMDLSGQSEVICPKCKSLVFIDTDNRQIFIRESGRKSNGV